MLSPPQRDTLLLFSLRFLTMVSAGIIVLVVVFVGRESLQVFQQSEGSFFLTSVVTDDSWNPAANEYDLKPMIVGSLLATFGSALLTAPMGIGLAVFLNFYAPNKLSWLFRRAVEMMAGVPSVVYGLWGLSVLVPLIAEISPLDQGQSLLAGILILTFMTLPTVVVAADAALQSVPESFARGANALGISRRAIVWSVVIPAARWGLASAVILQISRAIGETMAVLMVCGNIVQTPDSIFAPVRTLTANIALEMGYADAEHRSILFLSGLLGLGLVAALMLFTNFLSRKK